MNLAKEYVIRDERRETTLVDNDTAKNKLQILVHKCFWNFSQAYNYYYAITILHMSNLLNINSVIKGVGTSGFKRRYKLFIYHNHVFEWIFCYWI